MSAFVNFPIPRRIINPAKFETGISPVSVIDLPKWRKARAMARLGLGVARVLCIGDSNTMGGSAVGANLNRRLHSYPNAMAPLIGGTAHDTFGNGGVLVADYPSYDPRLTIGAGWGFSTPTAGGSTWVNNTTTDALAFTPEGAWSQADVWLALTEATTVSVGIAGNMTSYTPAINSVVRITYTAPTSAVQALQIARVSGNARVIGWSCRAASGIAVLGAGRQSWKTTEWLDATNFASPRNSIAAIAPDICLICLGLNDFGSASPIPLVDYRANMATLIGVCKDAGADVAMIVPLTQAGSAWPDWVAAMYSVATEAGVPVIDMTERFGTREQLDAAGWATNALHPNSAGYAEIGHVTALLLNR